MSKKKKKNVYLYESHGKPVTRRDFLKSGLISMAGSVVVPSVMTQLLWTRQALGQECSAAGLPTGWVPILQIDLQGGAAMSGNFVPLDATGSTLPFSNKLGVPDNFFSQPGATNTQFGIPFYAGVSPHDGKETSKFLEGLKTTPNAGVASDHTAALNNLRIGTICNATSDDTDSNPQNIGTAIAKLFKASIIELPIGTGKGGFNPASPGNSSNLITGPVYKAKEANHLYYSVEAGKNVLNLPDAVRGKLAEKLFALSSKQKKKLEGTTLQTLGELAKCGYEVNNLQAPSQNLNPFNEQTFKDVWGTSPTKDEEAQAAVLYWTLMGYAPCGTIALGGYDYHNNDAPGSSSHGDNQDRIVGQLLSKIFTTAKKMNKDILVYIFSDGGCDAKGGERKWTSDDGNKYMSALCYMKSGSAPTQIRTQVGHFNATESNQGVDGNTSIGARANGSGLVTLWNFLTLIGRQDLFGQIVSEAEFKPGSEHLIFT